MMYESYQTVTEVVPEALVGRTYVQVDATIERQIWGTSKYAPSEWVSIEKIA